MFKKKANNNCRWIYCHHIFSKKQIFLLNILFPALQSLHYCTGLHQVCSTVLSFFNMPWVEMHWYHTVYTLCKYDALSTKCYMHTLFKREWHMGPGLHSRTSLFLCAQHICSTHNLEHMHCAHIIRWSCQDGPALRQPWLHYFPTLHIAIHFWQLRAMFSEAKDAFWENVMSILLS